ncbi:hypothetical protein LV85_01398 [Algoriphagus chordae]|uniref:Uncharacterized protein n=1 Tax=Algoriphagus chordae TaxID=237019 RepID=A0A2W7RI74_9BACT|nr:hypothetical protein LV85_01398 [Algoriphagus chordae]
MDVTALILNIASFVIEPYCSVTHIANLTVMSKEILDKDRSRFMNPSKSLKKRKAAKFLRKMERKKII